MLSFFSEDSESVSRRRYPDEPRLEEGGCSIGSKEITNLLRLVSEGNLALLFI
jgi:hypothetical protein